MCCKMWNGALPNIYVVLGGFEAAFNMCYMFRCSYRRLAACNIDRMVATPGCCLDATARPIFCNYLCFIVIAAANPTNY